MPSNKSQNNAISTVSNDINCKTGTNISEKDNQRQLWDSNTNFILACIGNAIGLGNIWRFPYLCYDSGGGAFLFVYVFMLLICGFPLLYMEYVIGQWTRLGPIGAIQKLCPLWQGIGAASVVLSIFFCSYYNVIVSWILFYLFQSLRSELPWSTCNHDWSSSSCWNPNMTDSNSKPDFPMSPTREFYENRMLKKTGSIDNFGSLQLELLGCLILSWVMVYFCVFKGVKVVGKVVYVTALFPFLVIIFLLVRGVTLPNASEGIKYFIQPKWHQLINPLVWVNAAAQTFNSLSIGFGSMIAFSSYRAKDAKIFKDTLIIGIVNSITSIVCGIAIFSTLGYVAGKQGVNVTDVVEEGPGLVFIVYPEAFVSLKGAPFFSAIFFLMLLCLAIDSQFASVEVIISTIEDIFGKKLRQYMRKEFHVLILCVILFFMSLPNIFGGGIYYFKIIDKFSSGVSLNLVVFFETIAVMWFYGGKRIFGNIKTMTGSEPNKMLLICWYVLSPILILIIMIYSWKEYKPLTYGKKPYPEWAHILGWLLATCSLICIPIGMIKSYIEARGTNVKEKMLNCLVSRDESNKCELEIVDLEIEVVHLGKF